MKKICNSCGEKIDHYALGMCLKCYKKDYREKHKEKYNIYQKKYNSEHPDYGKDSSLKRKYGISIDQYKILLDTQNGQCAICGVQNNIADRMFCVDHDHKTGNIRALLCGKCNLMLGLIDENTEILENAIAYIRFFNNKFDEM